MSDDYKFGIEEEYFLVDAETKSVAREMPRSSSRKLKSMTGGQVMGEMLQSQLEVATAPHHQHRGRAHRAALPAPDGRQHRGRARACDPRRRHASDRADGASAVQTPADRYDNVMEDLQMIGQRNMLCGLHVHVELPDPDDRVDIMMRMLPYLPLFIALATSSPFWRARPTGLKGYRLAAYDELPRTGVPELFRTPAEYEAYISALVNAGVMEDSSYVWWAIRPSLKHPTLELRAPDSCTLVEDFDRDRGALSHARAAAHAQSVAELGPDRRDPRDRGREQVARAALRRARHLRGHLGQRRDLGRRNARAGDRGGRARRAGARLPATRSSIAAPSSAAGPRPTRSLRCSSRRRGAARAAPMRCAP